VIEQKAAKQEERLIELQRREKIQSLEDEMEDLSDKDKSKVSVKLMRESIEVNVYDSIRKILAE
jgi:hypothetical protein